MKSGLVLFLSVDIVGSTAFKSFSSDRSKVGEQPWLQVFRSFHSDFPTYLFQNLPKSLDSIKPPSVWKTAGDEIIFTKTIDHVDQIRPCILAFIDAIDKYKTEFLKTQTPPLDLKGAAWLAGYPVINARLEKHNDYIGPSIDTGFRLCQKATSRKFIISADLAYILADRAEHGEERRAVKIHYDGNETLKGVLGGKPYPIFWVDPLEEKPLEERLSGTERHACRMDDVKIFTSQFIESYNNEVVLCLPYIADNPGYGSIPKSHEKIKADLDDYDNNYDVRSAESKDVPLTDEVRTPRDQISRKSD